jgi:three-Cys-motif partner protein
MHFTWDLVKKAGSLKTIELFINFPALDIKRNILLESLEKVKLEQIERMDYFWGNDKWKDILFKGYSGDLFGKEQHLRTEKISTLADEYRRRLSHEAGFSVVLDPLPMKDEKGLVLYYLFFASQKPVAKDIVEHIFKKFGK